MSLFYLSEINIYPIKSLRGISLDTAKVERRGLQYDRRWMLVDENNKFLTQREFPKMARIWPTLAENGLEISAEGVEKLTVSFEPEGESFETEVWGNKCEVIAYQNFVNEWFSEVLGANCRLVYMPDTSERSINPRFNLNNDIVSLADGYPFLLIGESSLAGLNARLGKNILMNRFRPNLVIKYSPEMYEDRWQKIKIGKTVFRATKPCARCVMTTIDQSKGLSDGPEPLRTLAQYRQAKDVFPHNFEELGLDKNAVLFGQNLTAENFGEVLRVSQPVEVVEWRSFGGQ